MCVCHMGIVCAIAAQTVHIRLSLGNSHAAMVCVVSGIATNTHFWLGLGVVVVNHASLFSLSLFSFHNHNEFIGRPRCLVHIWTLGFGVQCSGK